MGTSFVNFEKHGLWVNDGALEIWLLLLLHEIDSMPQAPDWLKSLRNQWYIVAAHLINGCAAKTENHKNKFITLCQATLNNFLVVL